ncbi:hypothetical protein AKO1_007369, partial [Acrasis kona]
MNLDVSVERDVVLMICKRFYEVFCNLFNAEQTATVGSPHKQTQPTIETAPTPVHVPGPTPVRSRSTRPSTARKIRVTSDAPAPRVRRRVVGMTMVKALAKTNELLFKRGHSVLVIDKLLQKLPIESIPSLRSHSLSRIPSLHLLPRLLSNSNRLVDANDSFYVLNPGGDLKPQKYLEEFFQKYEGISGTQPNSEQIYKALQEKDLYIFCGHGAGENYYNVDQVKRLNKCAVSILMGCSSAALTENGEYEPSGTVLSYLLAGSPCVIGNLWDVTDGDCDRYTYAMLDMWFSGSNNLSECMVKAREECKMKYLMGAAAVCYGL